MPVLLETDQTFQVYIPNAGGAPERSLLKEVIIDKLNVTLNNKSEGKLSMVKETCIMLGGALRTQ